jgi:hypothetical protein
MIGSHTFQAADGDRFFFNATAAAGGFTGSVAGAAEDARKDIGLPVDHICIVVAALGDHPDILRDGGVGRTGILTINDFMEILGILKIGRFQNRRY